MTRRPRPASPGAPAPSAARREGTSTLRRATQVVLVLGTVLALLSAVGPLWLVRVGVVVAVVAGVLACALAWRELFWARRQHARAMLAASREHGAALHEERNRNADVVDTLTERVRSAGMVVAGQRSTIAGLHSTVAGLRGEVSALTDARDALVGAVAARDGVIGLLRSTMQQQEAALIAPGERPEEAPGSASVHHMPRRVRTDRDAEPVDTDVVDLKTLETAMVLPNYEGDRRVG